MTFEEYKEKHHLKVGLWPAKKLRADTGSMKDSAGCKEGRDWALRQKPGLKRVPPPKMVFLGLKPADAPIEPKTPQIEPQEPEEKPSKTGKIMRDLKIYKESKGFI